MEYMGGVTLKYRIGGHPLEPELSLSLAIEIADAQDQPRKHLRRCQSGVREASLGRCRLGLQARGATSAGSIEWLSPGEAGSWSLRQQSVGKGAVLIRVSGPIFIGRAESGC
jgi:hypothetical protein